MIEWLDSVITREMALFLGLAPVALIGIARLVHVLRAGRRRRNEADDPNDDPDNDCW